MNEVVEVLIDKSPFLVMLAELFPVILQEVRFVLALVEEIISFIYDGFEPPTSDCFSLFRHGSVEVAFTLVLGIGIDVNVQSFMADGLHCFLIPVARIIIKVER